MTTLSPSPSELPEHDRELLSAYIDNELTPAERAVLEQRLRVEPSLRRELAELRAVRDLLHEQPWVTLPRTFTLTPEMAGVRRRQFALSGWWQPLSGLAALVLVILVSWQILGLNNNPASAPQVMMSSDTISPTTPAFAAALPESPVAENAPAIAARPNEVEQAEPSSEAVLSTMAEPTIPANGTARESQAVEPDGSAGAQSQPVQSPPLAPPSWPLAITLTILLLIVAGIWFVRRRAE
ncbi:anti-sigma factor family protein [Chloroflexus sp.]|uniref:anti-sigma factor family protein n=1 Tax=Chloroflexus sp. TaxID=1904827 RepID=UPI002ADE5EC5|nr:zf-HC2 domain-containing protein [Chloroflexus sp.]